MSDKSYVTLAVCPICGKENGEILMDRRLKPVFEKHTTNPVGVCEKCREKYLKHGVMLVNMNSARLVVIKDEAFKRLFNKPIPKGKIVATDDEVLDKFQEKGGE